MTIYGALRIQSDVAEDLHANYGVYEKKHGYEQADVGQSFKGLNKRPEQNSNRVALTKQFD